MQSLWPIRTPDWCLPSQSEEHRVLSAHAERSGAGGEGGERQRAREREKREGRERERA